ncbi:MAG: glycoside hydrolase family 16 protein [Bacteroidales bacterium]|nr:glycoside hydrolase family 16 protein [Bacteroidales bacterium]
MKLIKFIVFAGIFLFLGCSSKPVPVVPHYNEPEVDFTYNTKNNTDSTNYIVFHSKITGSYSHLEWSLAGESLQQDTTFTYYFPKKGDYTVSLSLFLSDGSSLTTSKQITISSDDPNYTPNKLIWSDEFNGTSLNTSNWNYDLGSSGWGNNELENYTDQNALVNNGFLSIVAKLVGPGQSVGDYTSSRINTSGKKEFLYGIVEVKAKLPGGRGTWPAFWMLGSDIGQVGWPACGELDIMENVGYDPTWVQGSIHTPSSYGNTVNNGRIQVTDCDSAYHIYGMTWTPSKIKFWVDDPSNAYYTYSPAVKDASNWPFNKPCFIILNLAIGGNWGGAQGVDDSVFPQTYKIDYVRVYSYQ